jgi:hypothetical protein
VGDGIGVDVGFGVAVGSGVVTAHAASTNELQRKIWSFLYIKSLCTYVYLASKTK